MLFYFSGTGNTRWLARTLGEALNERVIDITDVMDDDTTYRLSANERLGFCFPVHGWRPPFLMRQFIRRLKIENATNNYVYAFATCGDDVGRTFEYLQDDLATIDLHTDSVFSIVMPESYLFPFYDAIDKPERAQQKKLAGEAALHELLPAIRDRVKGIRHVNESHWPRTNSWFLGAFFLHQWVTDKHFRVADNRCRHCGLCAKACPVSNIRCEHNAQPQWLHNGRCTTCFSCYHHCPAHAITYGTRTALSHRQYYFDKA